MVNAGIGANLISEASPKYAVSGKPAADVRLDKHVLAHKPDLVVISYGLNDARGGTPLPFFETALRGLVHRVHTSALPPPVCSSKFAATVSHSSFRTNRYRIAGI